MRKKAQRVVFACLFSLKSLQERNLKRKQFAATKQQVYDDTAFMGNMQLMQSLKMQLLTTSVILTS